MPSDRDVHRFDPAELRGVYRAIFERRDVRRNFIGGTLSDDLVMRLLEAAHHGPSVGFMQPWRAIRVRSTETRLAIRSLVERERLATAEALGPRREEFSRLKVEGILECAELIVIALAPGRDEHVFGRRTLPEMDVASVGCAIQNLWLAARAEGVGVGWVSIFDPGALCALLEMPDGSRPLAVLCLGPVSEFGRVPELEARGWASRQSLESLVFEERWGAPMIGSGGSDAR